jgi:hypothetical protein
MFLALENLVSTAVNPCTPWTFTQPVPDGVKGKENKKIRDKWISNPNTKHQVYTAFEGVIPNARIAEPANGNEGNPPQKLHAFVADIDSPVSDEALLEGIGRLGDLVPNYFERTLSGNARLIWLLEQPVSFPNRRFAVEFMKLAWARMGVEQIAAAVDKPAWEEPNRYYTNSSDWNVVDAAIRIPHALTQGWIVEVSEKHHWKKDRGAVDIPLPVVWVELQKKFPVQSAAWTNDFTEGAQGPTFWVEGSSSPKSAIVKPTGLFTFSQHAIKPFWSWTDLLGKDFTDKYLAEMMGKAVEGIYHDGKAYFRKDGFGDWKAFAKEDIVQHLSVSRGLSNTKENGAHSEVSRALEYIHNFQGVLGAAPFIFQPTGLVRKRGASFLNTHTRKVCPPAQGKQVWGPTGNFPTISAFFDGLFHPDTPGAKEHFLAWLKLFYESGYFLAPRSGQSFLLSGPPNVGKTFLNQGLIPRLMGGSADAQSYLIGETDFNSQLFEVPYWYVDDQSSTVDNTSHRHFSSSIKKMAANQSFQWHAKFRVPCEIEWMGRVGLTCNADEESLRIIPDLSISILDKINLYRTAVTAPITFPDRRGCEKFLDDELPFFARWLLDWEIPKKLHGDARYGIVSFHDPVLMRTADQSSRTAGFLEVVEYWRGWYFSENSKSEWSGTAFALLVEMNKHEPLREAGLRGMTPTSIGLNLSAVKSKGCDWLVSHDSAVGRVWTVQRPVKNAPPVVDLPVGTKFQKETTK